MKILIVIFLFFVLAMAQNEIQVTGTGKLKAPADLAVVDLSVTQEHKTASQAHMMAADRANQVIDALKNYQLQNVYTYGLRVEPKYNWIQNKNVLDGYTASSSVHFEGSPSQVPLAVDNIMNNVQNVSINSMTATLKEDTKKTILPQVIILAIKDARMKADIIANELGVTISGPNVVTFDSHMPINHPMESRTATLAMPSATFIPQDQEITASISINYNHSPQ